MKTVAEEGTGYREQESQKRLTTARQSHNQNQKITTESWSLHGEINNRGKAKSTPKHDLQRREAEGYEGKSKTQNLNHEELPEATKRRQRKSSQKYKNLADSSTKDTKEMDG